MVQTEQHICSLFVKKYTSIECQTTDHQAAEKTMEKTKENKLETLTSDMQRDHFLTTDRVFRTVYKIVKSGGPFTDLPTDINLQVLNGLDRRTLHSDHSCATISQHIAN